jgi:hypothetical protein
VRHVREQSPERDDELDADRLRDVHDQPAERPPPKRRLGAGEQDEIARRPRDADLVELDLGPHDLSRLTLRKLDPRPRGLEVVELLGVDRGEPPSSERRADECVRGRGGVCGVVPALEGADERWCT